MGDLALSVYGGTTYGYPNTATTAASPTQAAYGSQGSGGGASWASILNPLTSPHGISILGAVAAVALLIFIRQSLPA